MIGGNTTAQIQISTTEKNEIGESVKAWTTVDSLKGYIDMTSGDAKYTTYNSKIQESTHVFISDWKQLDARIKAENSRIVVNCEAYDVTFIDDPMGLHKQLEIYLKYVGGQNVSRVL